MKRAKGRWLGRLRVLVPLAVLVAATAGVLAGAGTGTLCAVGWQDVALLCPLGALSSMLASKTALPREVFSLLAALVLILLFGRAFCAWVCPVPLVARLRGLFRRGGGKKPVPAAEARATGGAADACAACGTDGAAEGSTPTADGAAGCGVGDGAPQRAHRRGRRDGRHLVLGGALLSAAVFGFPVFCLVCPIGLTFAAVLMLVALFTEGAVSWTIVVVLALLLVEVVFFRKWCARICPLGALMGLVAKANRTFRPSIDGKACLETVHGAACGRCAAACEQRIDLRDLAHSKAPLAECTRCRSCVAACPAHAVGIHALPPRRTPSGGVGGPAEGAGEGRKGAA